MIHSRQRTSTWLLSPSCRWLGVMGSSPESRKFVSGREMGHTRAWQRGGSNRIIRLFAHGFGVARDEGLEN